MALLLPGFISGCTVEPEHPALARAKFPPLMQANRIAYQGQVHSGYKLSPDGRKLAWHGPHFWRSALHVRDNKTGEVRRFRVGGEIQWTPNGRWLLFTADSSGSEDRHVYVIDTDDPDAAPVDLTPWPGVRASVQRIVAEGGGGVLIYHNRRDRRVFDLYLVDLVTRKASLVARNPGDATAAVTGEDGSFKGWLRSRTAQRRDAGPPRSLAARKPDLVKEPEETFRVLGLNADRSIAWAFSDRGRDRLALVAAHPTLGWEKVVFEDPDADVSHVQMSAVKKAPLVAHAMPGYPRFEILDAQLREDLAGLMKAQGSNPFDIRILSTDAGERRLVVLVSTDVQQSTYLVDRDARTHVLVAQSVPDGLAALLSPMRPVTIASRDGLKLHGYLTLPRGVAAKGLPMVLHVHGGPWMRTGWSDPLSSEDAAYAQFLANRGYAVLQVDFRGSSGYGRSFMHAAVGEFAGRMQDDLLDAVRWAVDAGIADPRRVAIMGWSYGGYAALVGLSMTPDAFACGVSLSGPTDLATLIESFPAYWTVDLSRWHDFVGDPTIPEDREAMQQKSPLQHARAVERPVLIIHGARDVRVRVDQSDRMAAALGAAGKAVEYLRIPDMGHGTGWWVHRLAVLRRTEDFLQRCLGGRASRFDPFDAAAWAWTRIGGWRSQEAPPPPAPAAKSPAQEAVEEERRH